MLLREWFKSIMCDTPVSYFDAGIPTYNGESTRGEFVNLPKEIVDSGLVVMETISSFAKCGNKF